MRIQNYYVQDDKCFIVCEQAIGNDLGNRVGIYREEYDDDEDENKTDIIIQEQKAAYIMYQIFKSLHYIHSKDIVHRDIKP